MFVGWCVVDMSSIASVERDFLLEDLIIFTVEAHRLL